MSLSANQLIDLRSAFEKKYEGSLAPHPAYKDQYRNIETQNAWIQYLCAALDEQEEKQ